MRRERRIGVLKRYAQQQRWGLLSILLIALLAWRHPGPAEAKVTFAQLTNTSVGNNYEPSITADGTRIAFTSNRNLTGSNPDANEELFLWTQGVGFTQLTNTTGHNNTSPSITADGAHIAFVSSSDLTPSSPGNADHNRELFLWTQGVGFTQLTNTTDGSNAWPSISADGARIAFASNRNLTGSNADGSDELFLWTQQGSGFTQLTNTIGVSHNFIPSITADGTRIAFVFDRDLTPGSPGNADGNLELFLWTQGVGFTQLTNTTIFGNYDPSISADGAHIAFVSSSDLTPSSPGNPDANEELFLWTQGVGFTQLTNTTGYNNTSPSITADGAHIAFVSSSDLTPSSPGNADHNRELFLWTQGVGFAQFTNTTGGGNNDPSITADGAHIAFPSWSDVTPGSPGNADGNEELFFATLTVPPTPDIKANGADGPLTIPSGSNLTVTVALNPGSHAGTPADWWVAATSPFGLYWYTLGGWVRSDAPIRTHGGPLFTLAPYEVLNMSTLPIGGYTFYFGVDMLMNGALDFGQLHVDSVAVQIQ